MGANCSFGDLDRVQLFPSINSPHPPVKTRVADPAVYGRISNSGTLGRCKCVTTEPGCVLRARQGFHPTTLWWHTGEPVCLHQIRCTTVLRSAHLKSESTMHMPITEATYTRFYVYLYSSAKRRRLEADVNMGLH